MTTKSTGFAHIDALYRPAAGRVEFVDVPELAFVTVEGAGAPGGPEFTAALQALYTVSYGAHFALRKAGREAPRVMPLEALWWVEGADALATMQRVAAGEAALEESRRDSWRWRAMIQQLPPVDEAVIAAAVSAAGSKHALPALHALCFERWTEGPSAQILHVGPYSTEQGTIVVLHRAIADHGSRPRGRHHEIYLGDPRTSAPERLRTILRQPVEPAAVPVAV